MKTLYFALIAAWFAQAACVEQEGNSSPTVALPKPHYGGFSSDPDSLQVFYDYIHGQEMMKVEAGAELRQAVEAIPLDLGASIDLAQEAALRDWLYELLVVFSASGSDSLAAAFYLREGVNNPDGIDFLKEYLASNNAPIGDTPFAMFASGHRVILDLTKRDYFLRTCPFSTARSRYLRCRRRTIAMRSISRRTV